MRTIAKTIRRAYKVLRQSRRLDRAFKRYLQQANQVDGQEGLLGPEHRRQAWRILGLALAAYVSLC